MSRSRGKAPSQRQLRVGEELRHALSRIFARGGFADPALSGANVTVSEVRVSPDLKSARAYVTPLGGGDVAATVVALNRAAGFVRARLGEELVLRYLPRIAFEADLTFDHAMHMQSVMDRPRVRQDLADLGDGRQSSGSDEPGNQGGDGHGA